MKIYLYSIQPESLEEEMLKLEKELKSINIIEIVYNTYTQCITAFIIEISELDLVQIPIILNTEIRFIPKTSEYLTDLNVLIYYGEY